MTKTPPSLFQRAFKAALVSSVSKLLIRSVSIGVISVSATLPAAPTLTPRVSFPDSPVLTFDFPGMTIGIAEYEEGPTGMTVFRFPQRVMAAVDVRGGSPGITGSEALRLGYDTPIVDAIAFSGGSSYGLEAVDGVRSALLKSGTHSAARGNIANVPGAIIYDFTGRTNSVHPDRELAAAALDAAQPNRFYQGPRGAGRFAAVGKYYGAYYMEMAGQGGAFRQIGKTRLAVFTIVNARGAIVDRSGRVVRGNRDPETGVHGSIGDELTQGRAAEKRAKAARASKAPSPGGGTGTNTTLTLVVTDQKLSIAELQRLAVQTHTSMGRAIQPFQTRGDGDVLFAVTTGQVANVDLDPADLATYAGELAWDAVLNSFAKSNE